jgi:membrane-associated phospholipid phosphatase
VEAAIDRRGRTALAGCVLAGCGLGGFALLTVLAATGVVGHLDHSVWRQTVVHWHPALGRAGHDITDVLSPPVDATCLALGLVVIAVRDRRRDAVVAAAVTGLVAAVAVLVTKWAVGRLPPRGNVLTHGGSFPSGHTAAAVVCFGALALLVSLDRPWLRRPLLLATAAATIVVATALVYIAAHWLTDVVASALLGVGLLALLDLWLRRGRQPAYGVTTGTSFADTLAP